MTDFNPPTTSLFSYNATGASSVAAFSINYDSAKGYSLARSDTGTGGADRGAFQGKAVASGSSWTAKTRVKLPLAANSDRIRGGLALYESGTGKWLWVGVNLSTGTPQLQCNYGNGLDNYGTEAISPINFSGRIPDYFAIQLSGSNYVMQVSFDDGITYQTVATVAKTTAFTTAADKIGFIIESYGTIALKATTLVYYYNDPDF